MTTTTKTTCDGCGKELPETVKGVDYRLVLTTKEIGTNSGFVTGITYPPIKADKHFCGVNCVGLWVERGYP